MSFPLTNPAGTWDYYQGTHAAGGTNDLFITEFANAGARIWSTFFGGTNNELSTSIALDTDDNLFVTANTNGNNCPIPSPNLSGGYVSTYDASQDGIIIGFNKFHKNIWGTYFGGNGYEKLSRCATVSNSRFYVVGGEVNDSASFPIVNLAGAYNQPKYGTNAIIAGFDLSSVVLASISENSIDAFEFAAFPNPAGNYLNIFVNSNEKQNIAIQIVNLLGQTIFDQTFDDVKGERTVVISTEDLSSGMYIVSVKAGAAIGTKKIIKY